MNLTINGNNRQFDTTLSVEDLLDTLDIAIDKGVAVAVNYSVVPKKEYQQKMMLDGDKVEIIHAVQGG